MERSKNRLKCPFFCFKLFLLDQAFNHILLDYEFCCCLLNSDQVHIFLRFLRIPKIWRELKWLFLIFLEDSLTSLLDQLKYNTRYRSCTFPLGQKDEVKNFAFKVNGEFFHFSPFRPTEKVTWSIPWTCNNKLENQKGLELEKWLFRIGEKKQSCFLNLHDKVVISL